MSTQHHVKQENLRADNVSPVSFDSSKANEDINNHDGAELPHDLSVHGNDIAITNLDTDEKIGLSDLDTLLGDLTLLVPTFDSDEILGKQSSGFKSPLNSPTFIKVNEPASERRSNTYLNIRNIKKSFGVTSSSASNLVADPEKSRAGEKYEASLNYNETCDERVPVKTNKSDKKSNLLNNVRFIQCLKYHTGPIWVMKFSYNGLFFATAGQDGRVIIWRIMTCAEIESQGLINPEQSMSDTGCTSAPLNERVVCKTPWKVLGGDKNEKDAVLALAWSKSQFLLSGTMSGRVMLWHVTRNECLGIFDHDTPVTCLDFHPAKDSLFISGSFDMKLRMWNIPTGEIIHWIETPNKITALSFMKRRESTVVVGFVNGQCIFYHYRESSGFEYSEEIDCRNKNVSSKNGKKVSGIETFLKVVKKNKQAMSIRSRNRKSLSGLKNKDQPSTASTPEIIKEYVLITTNDSRIRLFETEGFSCIYKFKGHLLNKGPIAAISADSDHVICASEDRCVYIWDYGTGSSTSTMMNKVSNSSTQKVSKYEAFASHNTIATAARMLSRKAVDLARGMQDKEGTKSLRLADEIEASSISNRTLNAESSTKEADTFKQDSDKAAASTPFRDAIFVVAGLDGHIHVFENNA